MNISMHIFTGSEKGRTECYIGPAYIGPASYVYMHTDARGLGACPPWDFLRYDIVALRRCIGFSSLFFPVVNLLC